MCFCEIIRQYETYASIRESSISDSFMLYLFIIITIMSVITLFVIAFSYVVKFLIGIIIKLIRKNDLDKF